MHHERETLLMALLAVATALPLAAATPLQECWQRSANRSELGSCLGELVNEADARLRSTLTRAEAAQAELDEVTGRPDSVDALRRSQMAFELYRELECSARRTQMASGSGSGDAYQSCWVELSRARIAALEGQGGAPPDLMGSSWRVASVAGQAVADGLEATMAFTADGRITGTTGCNNYFGSATVGRGSLELGPVGATRRLCASPANELETSFLGALDKAAAWQSEGEALVIRDAEGNELLRLEEMPVDAEISPP